MFLNRVVLYDDHCDIYFNTNDDKSKHLKLKEQLDLESEILFENKKNTTSVLAYLKKEQSKLKSSDYSLMAGLTKFRLNYF
ncbi:MAG TPA: hypothetical protein DEV78_04010 [Clostridiales bacterium]|nr:hypothetical protein [Clostridiales bacterium]